MKTVIILGEEYWFARDYENFKTIGADKLIKKIKEENKDLRIVFLDSPRNIINEIKKYDNVIGIFLFHDVFSDSFVDRKTIKEMKGFFSNLEEKIYLYPGVEKTMLFGSKGYYKTLIDEMPYASLPYSDVLEIKNYQGESDEGKIKDLLIEKSKKLFETFDKIVIKKGYSYEGKQVKVLPKSILDNMELFREKLDGLNFKKFFGQGGNAIKWEKGVDRYYILQGYNRIVKKRTNEYRVFILNGLVKYIAWGDNLPNLCSEDESYKEKYNLNNLVTPEREGELSRTFQSIDRLNNFNRELLVEVLRFTKKVYNDFKPKFWSSKIGMEHPILFRVDVSYAEDDIFQDEHSIELDGRKIRLYVNELEIDPTSFFYNHTVCQKNKEISSEYLEEKMGEYINEHLKKIK